MKRPLVPELPPGTDIGGMKVVERVGSGGFGTVYKAVSGSGRVYAVKFIPLNVAEDWALREFQATLKLGRLHHQNLVCMSASGHHPAAAPAFMWMAFDFIEGPPLDEWARLANPSAAELVRKLLGVVRGLAVAHGRRVVHRDVKEANILVREADGEAVLIDFGVGWFSGAVTITEGLFPPGTPDYRAPEAWRFSLENQHRSEARYRPGPSDDLYAVGVVLYALLTGQRPFHASEEGGVRAILNEPPLPPHVVNPSVPAELAGLCLRLLAKRPEERPPDALTLLRELEAMLASADARWTVPLRDSPRPVRVERPPPGEEAPLAPEAAPEATTSEVPPHLVLGSIAPARVEESARPRAPRAGRRAWGLGGAVLAACVGLGVFLVLRPDTRPSAAPVERVTPGQEVAPPGKPPDSERAAAPPRAVSTPAAVAPRAMPPKESVSVTTQKNPREAQQPKQPSTGRGAVGKTLGVAVTACTLAVGCAGPQVRAEPPASHPARPPPEPCPPGAAEAMEKLGIDARSRGSGTLLLTPGNVQVITVTKGPVKIRKTLGLGDLPQNTLLHGRLIFGERIYGRFTRARSAEEGLDIPVCLEVWDAEGGRGLLYEGTPGPTTAKTWSSVYLRAVKEFQ